MTNLYKKLHAIMCETEGIEKNLEVGFGSNKYKAVGEASVLNAIKPLLKKHGVIIVPVMVKAEESKETFSTAKGQSERLLTTVHATFKVADVDSGESMHLQTVGHGADNQDKGTGKALTYAYKALLQKTFMLFSGEDTDNTHSDKMTDDQMVKLSNDQVAEIEKLLAEHEDRDLKAKMLKGYEVSDIKEINAVNYNQIIKRLKK